MRPDHHKEDEMPRIAAIACLLALGASACTGITTHQRPGITVYDPTYYLVVGGQGAAQTVELFVGPDLESSYQVSGERSFLMKSQFAFELEDGMLTRASAQYDSSPLLSFFQEAARTAAGAASPGAARSGVSGFQMDLGLAPGLYKLDPRTQALKRIFAKGDPQP